MRNIIRKKISAPVVLLSDCTLLRRVACLLLLPVLTWLREDSRLLLIVKPLHMEIGWNIWQSYSLLFLLYAKTK